jgi:hypothetical protein
MASRRKTHTRSPFGDRQTYAEIMRDLVLAGKATALHDVTVPDGSRQVSVPQFDGDGRPLPPVVVTVQARRLVSVEYDDPNG